MATLFKQAMAIFHAFLISISALYSQNTSPLWKGYWKGDLVANGVQLSLIFHIQEPQEIGGLRIYKSTLTVPMQGLKNFKIDETIIKGNAIEWILSFPASFKGKYNENGDIVGNWKQGGMSFPLVLRHSDLLNTKKPQTPSPPYPYDLSIVNFSHPSGKLTLGGTLTYPKSALENENPPKKPSSLNSAIRSADSIAPSKTEIPIDFFNNNGNNLGRRYANSQDTALKYPLVLLISGSGLQDRDETIGDHKPFAVWADHLTKIGFAVLRVDDRGVGNSKGDPVFLSTTTTETLVSDANAAVQFSRTLSMIDSNRIFLMGHSEGVNIAIKLALQRNDIAGIVSLAGMTSSGIETSVFQNVFLWKAMGLDSNTIKGLIQLHREYIFIALKQYSICRASGVSPIPDNESLSKTKLLMQEFVRHNKKNKTIQKAWKYQLTQYKTMAKEQDGKKADALMASTYLSLISNPWWNYFLQYNPEPEFMALQDCDILMIQGAKDMQIDPFKSKRLSDQMKLAGIGVSYQEIGNLNHLLQHCIRCNLSEYFDLEETLAMEAMVFSSNWLIQQAKKH